MQQIRFRQAVYSKDKFNHWHYWGFLPDLSFVGPDSVNGLAHALANSQQLTGQLDKKGKEIWEKSIVSVDRQDSFPSWNKAVVIYADNYGSFLLQYTKPINPNGILADNTGITSEDKTTLFGQMTIWKLEVIGNVVENPELFLDNK